MVMLPYSPHSKTEQMVSAEPEREPMLPKPRSRWPLILGTTAILVLAGASFVYYYVVLKKPVPSVDLSMQNPEQVLLAEPFSLSVSYANDSDQALKDAVLTINLPEDVVVLGSSADRRFIEENLGSLDPGAYGKRELRLMVLKGPQSFKHLGAVLRYGLGDTSSHNFRKETGVDIAVGSSVLDANVIAPQSVMNAQSFDLSIKYRNASKTPLQNVKMIYQLPKEVAVDTVSSTVSGLEGVSGESAVWSIGALEPEASGDILMKASFSGSANSFSMPIKATAEFEGRTYELWTAEPKISVAQAPLALWITVNGGASTVAKPGDDLEYRLHYKNNSAIALENIAVTAYLSGSMYDLAGLRTKGVFVSSSNILTWNSANTPELARLNSGAEGEIEFAVPLKDEAPIRRISDKNFTVSVDASAESPTVPPNVAAERTLSAARLETKIAGNIALQTVAYYYEPTAGIKNAGPFPPRVDKATQFTVHWRLRNYNTDMESIRVVTKLAPGVRFVGAPKSSLDAKPVYNAQTGEVSWDILQLAATRGVIGTPVEAIFQIEVTPSINQVGQIVALSGPSFLTAKDSFTGKSVTQQTFKIDTGLPDDPRARNGGQVQP